MRLLILRHGLAVDRDAWIGPDSLRPLTPVGRRRTRKIVRTLAPLTTGLVAIWTSPWTRARETAELAGSAWDLPVEEHPWLAGDGPAASDCIGDLPREDTVLVGHEPDLGALIGMLMGGPPIPLKKAGLAVLTGQPVPGGMRLGVLLTPRAVLNLR